MPSTTQDLIRIVNEMIVDGTIDLLAKCSYVPLNRAGDTMSGPLNLGGNPLENAKAVTRHLLFPADEFARPPANSPAIAIYGICSALEFTVDTDKAYYKFHVPDDWVPGTDILAHIHWTRSSAVGDDSGKTVKWQVKYLAVDGVSENVNFGQATLSVQDTYDSSSLTDQIVYATDDVTVPAAALSPGDCVVLELMAVAPTGTALSEPACAALGVTHTIYQVSPA